MNVNNQKGQGLLEFALILPLFLLLALGTIFFGMMFADYVTLNSIASRAANDASRMSREQYVAADNSFEPIKTKFTTQNLPTGIFLWNPNSAGDFNLSYESANQAVVVEVTARLDRSSAFYPIAVNLLGGAGLSSMTVTYRMYSQEAMTDDSTS